MSVLVKQSLRGSINSGSVFKGSINDDGSTTGNIGVGSVIQGIDGVTFTPSLDEDGNLSWTNNGNLDNPETVNIKGPQGETGEVGPKGDPGKDGRVPIVGVDYYTEEDKQLIVDDIVGIMKDTATVAKLGEVTLLADAWIGAKNLYSQVVSIEGVTERSQVDLTPDVEQLAVFYEKDLAFVTENEDGVVTVYAIGQKPTNDYTIQVTITEVVV